MGPAISDAHNKLELIDQTMDSLAVRPQSVSTYALFIRVCSFAALSKMRWDTSIK